MRLWCCPSLLSAEVLRLSFSSHISLHFYQPRQSHCVKSHMHEEVHMKEDFIKRNLSKGMFHLNQQTTGWLQGFDSSGFAIKQRAKSH